MKTNQVTANCDTITYEVLFVFNRVEARRFKFPSDVSAESAVAIIKSLADEVEECEICYEYSDDYKSKSIEVEIAQDEDCYYKIQRSQESNEYVIVDEDDEVL